MNWEAAGAIGEIVGALAVVATLGYLAIQVRWAKNAAADTNRLNRANNVMNTAAMLVANPDVLRGLNQAEGRTSYFESYAAKFGLDAEQAGAVSWVHCYTFWMHWGQFSSSTNAEDIAELENVVAEYYRNPAVRFSWDYNPYAKPMLDQRFVRFVEQAIAGREEQ